MSTLTVESSRFGTIEIPAGAVIEFPAGLIGLGGRRWAVVGKDLSGPFQWLHSLDDGELALPVCNPWHFFADYEVELSEEDDERVGADGPEDIAVWVTVRAGSELSDFSANLRAPIVVCNGLGHQVINVASDAPVRAPLFPAAAAEEAAAA
jgi:flagellar assembly factor FliW